MWLALERGAEHLVDLDERHSIFPAPDGSQSLSYARSGTVEPAMATEALRARVAYLRLYVGEHAAKRERPLEA